MLNKAYREIIAKQKIIIRFTLVGSVGFFVNYLVFSMISYGINLPKQLSELVAIVVAVNTTFFLNDRWTYKNINRLSIDKRYAKYVASNSVGALITYISFIVVIMLTDHSKTHDLLALIVSSGLGMFWNYTINTYYIWKKNDRDISL